MAEIPDDQPDWDHDRAVETFERLRGKRLRRPHGKIVYEVVRPEQIHCGTAIRIRRSLDDPGYVICHNALLSMEEA